MSELADFIGKFKRLHEAGKEANLVLNTLAGSAWATLSVCIRPEGPGQQTHQRKARGARNGPAQQKRREKRASARATATAEAAAADVNEDATMTATVTATATAKEGPTERVDKTAESYAEKARCSSAEMRSGEGSKAGMSAMTTSASTKSSKAAGMESCEGSKTGMSARTTSTASTKSSKPSTTTGTASHIAAKAVVQTNTDLELTLSKQQHVAFVELTADRSRSAEIKTKVVDCAVQVAVKKTANKSVNARQEFANFRYDKKTQVTDDINLLPAEDEAKIERDMKELGWITPALTDCVRKIIQAKVNIEHILDPHLQDAGANRLLAKKHAHNAGFWEGMLLTRFYDNYHYDSKGMLVRMVQDEVIEVISWQERRDRESAMLNYIEEFMLCLKAKRPLTFR